MITRILTLHLALLAATLALTGCGRDSASAPAAAAAATNPAQKSYPIRGEIVELDRPRQVLVIHHEEIPGYMPAMTMEFNAPGLDFAQFRVGQKIAAQMGPAVDAIFPLTGIRFLDSKEDAALEAAARKLREDTFTRGRKAFREVGETAPAFTLYNQDGVAVSFDRPYGKYAQIYENPQSLGSGEWLCFEFPLAYWLEQYGYDVTYCSNSDCLDATQLTRAKAFLSVGHDEYWDPAQYTAVEQAIAAGVNVLWLCGNSVFVVSPFAASADGRPRRTIERVGHFAGVTDSEIEKVRAVFSNDYQRAGPDESAIIGARTVVPFNGGGDWTCTQPDHWIFAGTGMKKGDHIPGLVGWEHHGAPAKLPGLEVVAEGLVWASGVTPSRYAATIFPGPKNNFVFNAATIFWAQGLASPPGHMVPWSHWSRPNGPDARVQQITRNLLNRAIGP